MEYVVPAGSLPGVRDSGVVLPAFVGGTMGGILVPRPDTPLAAVHAPCGDIIRGVNKQGEWSATSRVRTGNFHVVPQAGSNYTVKKTLVQFPGKRQNPHALFRLGETTETSFDPDVVRGMKKLWHMRHRLDVAVYDIFRTHPAHVIGEISQQVEPGVLNADKTYHAHIDYADWPGERLLLICELPREGDWSFYQGLRVVPLSSLGREFIRWQRRNEVIEEFALPA